jgi:hypothetical protein
MRLGDQCLRHMSPELASRPSAVETITARGVKPKGKVQWQFKATYLYGIVEPATGEHFFYQFTHLNSDCFQVFLNLIAEQFSDSMSLWNVTQRSN